MHTCRIKTKSPGADGHRNLLFGKRAGGPGGGGTACRPLPRSGSGSSRTCLHVLAGRVDAPKICTRQFECYHCGFDQLLDDMDDEFVKT